MLACVCVVVCSLRQWYWALVTLTLAAMLYFYIDVKEVQADWGSGLSGLKLQQAWRALLAVTQSDAVEFCVNWRPQILCLYTYQRPDGSRGSDEKHESKDQRVTFESPLNSGMPKGAFSDDSGVEYLLRPAASAEDIVSFAHQLRKTRGMCVVATVVPGDYDESTAHAAAREEVAVADCMRAYGVDGFAKATVAPNVAVGTQLLVQSSGLGALSPNTVVVGWPRLLVRAGESHPRWDRFPGAANEFTSTISACNIANKALLVCKSLKSFPHRSPQQG